MKVLFVSLAAPPKTGGESLQVANVLQHLKQKCEITLLTETINYTSWNTNALSKSLLDKVSEIRVDVQPNRYLEKIKSLVGINNKHFPDIYEKFHVEAVKQIQNIDFDVIYSRAYPLSSALAGLNIKRATKKPWVLHLSDPWTLSPYHNYQSDKKHIEYEKLCFRLADAITFTTEKTRDLYIKTYPEFKEKFMVSYNSYNSWAKSNTSPNHSKKQSDKLSIVHTGNLYGSRHPKFLIDPLVALADDLKSRISIDFVGNIEKSMQDYLSKIHKLEINVTGPLSHENAKRKQDAADILISIDGYFENDEHALFMPSKLLEYMHAKKPIIAITNQDSPSYNFVKSGYGLAFTHKDVSGITKAFESLIINNPPTIELSEPNEVYSSENVTEKIFTLLQSTIK